MTIKDLARETGYSVGTISRVLNNQPNVSEKARKIILDCVQRSGFQLNTNAKHLKQQYGKGILAVVTGTSNELFAHMIEYIQQELSQTDYNLTVEYVEETDNAVQRALQRSREIKPQGLLFLGGDSHFFEQSFGDIDLPSVLLTADASELDFPNLSSVTTDDAAAACCAIEYLFSQGHRDIGIISGDLSCSGPGRLRYEGCCRAFRKQGLALPEENCVQARYSYSHGYEAALRLLSRKKFTAIFAMSDVMAIGAIRALQDQGLRVPEDVSVFGYDGLELGEYYVPKLTTVRQQADLLARRGVGLLLSAIESHSPARHEKVAFELAINASVARKD